MAAPNIPSYTNEYKFGRGRPFFNRLRDDGTYEGFKPFGNTPSFAIQRETQEFTHQSSEGGISTTDLQFAISSTLSAEMTVDNLNDENIALFASASVATLTQSAASVTNEEIAAVTSGATYRLGATTSNPAGVREVSAVTVRIKNGYDADDRANTTAYEVGDVYVPATPNLHWYVCTVAGTSAGSPPTFKTDGTTFADDSATFLDMGLIVVASTADVNYRLDADHALLSVEPGGTIATAITAFADYGAIGLDVDYTKAANTRVQISTGDASSVNGQFLFISDNPKGKQQDVFLPDVSLSPSGTLPFITGEEVASMTVAIGINKLNSTTASMYIDGRPES